MFSSNWLNCCPAKLLICFRQHATHHYEVLGLSSDHMCWKNTSSPGWMQPQWWQQICVWHWAYALFSLPCPGKSIITLKPLYFHRSSPHTPSPVFTPSIVACCKEKQVNVQSFVRTLHSLSFKLYIFNKSQSQNLISLLNSIVILPLLFL